MEKLEVKKELTYRWWSEDDRGLRPGHIEQLKDLADEVITEQLSEGSVCGHLDAELELDEDPTVYVNYRGYWESSTKDAIGKIVTFDYGELFLPEQALLNCYRPGRCDVDVEYWVTKIRWEEQTMTDDQIAKTLSEYGAWDEEELKDVKQNRRRILWLAAADYQEELEHDEHDEQEG